MPANIEIKARVTDATALRRRVESAADTGPTVIEQEDVFFCVPTGRLKLRIFADGSGELIQYHRPDTEAAKQSDYRIQPVKDPTGMRELLGRALGELVVVKKTRVLYLAGRTRIHLDTVEGLGAFMELEVVLAEGEEQAGGREEAARLMEQLGIGDADLVSHAYADLLMSRREAAHGAD